MRWARSSGPASIGAAAGIPEETFAAPGIRLRNAVALDHNGDSDGCLRVLRDIAADLARFVADGRAERLRPSSLAAYGYAAARRTALGDPGPVGPEPARLLDHSGDSARARDMRQLGHVCLAVADGRPIEAITRLDSAPVSAEIARRGRAVPAAQHRLLPGRRPRRRAPRRPDARSGSPGSAIDRLRDVYIDGVASRSTTRRCAGRRPATAARR